MRPHNRLFRLYLSVYFIFWLLYAHPLNNNHCELNTQTLTHTHTRIQTTHWHTRLGTNMPNCNFFFDGMLMIGWPVWNCIPDFTSICSFQCIIKQPVATRHWSVLNNGQQDARKGQGGPRLVIVWTYTLWHTHKHTHTFVHVLKMNPTNNTPEKENSMFQKVDS